MFQMTQLGGLQGQIVQGGTYLVSSAMDSDGQHITHTTRASPATVSKPCYIRLIHFLNVTVLDSCLVVSNYQT